MQAIQFVLDTLATLYEVVLLLRLLMQLTRADFRNPIARGIVQLTDPLIRPLRRVLPPIRRIDTASVLAIVVVAAAKLWVLSLLLSYSIPSGAPVLPSVGAVARATLLEITDLVLKTYLFSIILNAILSFVAPGNYSPAQSLLASICNPLLNPIRRVIPSIAGFDLSPLWACIAIQALLIILHLA